MGWPPGTSNPVCNHLVARGGGAVPGSSCLKAPKCPGKASASGRSARSSQMLVPRSSRGCPGVTEAALTCSLRLLRFYSKIASWTSSHPNGVPRVALCSTHGPRRGFISDMDGQAGAPRTRTIPAEGLSARKMRTEPQHQRCGVHDPRRGFIDEENAHGTTAPAMRRARSPQRVHRCMMLKDTHDPCRGFRKRKDNLHRTTAKAPSTRSLAT